MNEYIVGAVIILALWFVISIRSNFKAGKAFAAFDEAESWFSDEGIKTSSVDFSIYHESVLAKNHGASVAIGTAEKTDVGIVGFVLEVVQNVGVVEGVYIEPYGLCTWHRQAAQIGRLKGMSIIDVMQEAAEKRATKGANHIKNQPEQSKARAEQPKEEKPNPAIEAFKKAEERARKEAEEEAEIEEIHEIEAEIEKIARMKPITGERIAKAFGVLLLIVFALVLINTFLVPEKSLAEYQETSTTQAMPEVISKPLIHTDPARPDPVAYACSIVLEFATAAMVVRQADDTGKEEFIDKLHVQFIDPGFKRDFRIAMQNRELDSALLQQLLDMTIYIVNVAFRVPVKQGTESKYLAVNDFIETTYANCPTDFNHRVRKIASNYR